VEIKSPKWKSYILLTLAVFILIFIFEIVPDYSNIFGNLYSNLTGNNLNNDLKTCELKIKSLERENSKLSSSASNLLIDKDNQSDISSLLGFLDVVAQKSKITNYSLKPGTVFQNDNLSILPIYIEINGKYSNVYNFFYLIEKSSWVITIKSLTIKPKDVLTDNLIVKSNLEIYLNL